MTTYSDVSLMIDGAWTKGANGRTIPVINPATEEVIGTVAHAEKADLDRALAAADKGFKQWRKVSAYERYKIMRKAADLMRQRLDEIATIMTISAAGALRRAIRRFSTWCLCAFRSPSRRGIITSPCSARPGAIRPIAEVNGGNHDL